MNTYYIGDCHFDSQRVVELAGRPFEGYGEHDAHLLDRINSTVGQKDRLVIVGDFANHGADNIFKQIRCEHLHLIIGNHDPGKNMRKFKCIEDIGHFHLGPDKLLMVVCHYPFAYWHMSHRGSLHGYGHVHAEREEYLDAIWPDRRSMDLGVDNARRLLGDMRPFNEGEILDHIGSRPGHDDVEYYEHRRKARREAALKQAEAG